MEYAQFDSEGTLITQVADRESLPTVHRWEDGSVTGGFNTLEDEDLAKAGWYPVVAEDRPKFNDKKQMLSNPRIIMAEGQATRTWDVVDIPPEEPRPEPSPRQPSVEERLATLEQEVEQLKTKK